MHYNLLTLGNTLKGLKVNTLKKDDIVKPVYAEDS